MIIFASMPPHAHMAGKPCLFSQAKDPVMHSKTMEGVE